MPHPHTPYPAFDLHCITEIIRIVRAGAVRAELKWFVKHLYTIQGAALAMFPGEPDGGPFLGVVELDEQNAAQLEECRSALQGAEQEAGAFGAEADAEAIDPATLMLLIQLAGKLVTAWLERRKKPS